MKYLLDYGHGGNDPGAIGVDNLKEKDIVREIGKRVKYHLERHQQSVLESRPNDETVSLTERSNKANNNNVDLCISIHCNAFADSSAQGVEIFHHQASTRGQQLAKSILKEITKAKLYTKNRGLKTDNLHMTREPNMPSVLIELGFITNVTDKNLIVNNKENFAIAITRGILYYYGMTYRAETTQTTTTGKLYRVQVGAFSVKANAEKLVNELKQKGYTAITYQAENKLYRVQVGAFSVKANAEKLANELKQKGYNTIIV